MAIANKQWPEWARKRVRNNRIIGLALAGLVIFYVVLFVAKYVAR